MLFYVIIILISFQLSFLKSETCSDDNLIKPTFKDLWGYEFNWNNIEVNFTKSRSTEKLEVSNPKAINI